MPLFLRHELADNISVTGPHGALGTHVWDTTIGQYTKAYEQVRDVARTRKT